ncbi:MAG: Uma2 family endonuclease [Planctomycetaceae bacterium]
MPVELLEPPMTKCDRLLMTTEELYALPDDDVERELVRGQLREKPMTKRNRRHARTTSRVSQALLNWLDRQPAPRGEVLSGEAGVCLDRDPDTTKGVDVAYVSAETAAATPEGQPWIEGPPVLAVEILSPSDTHEDIYGKVIDYLHYGVQLVWVVDPDFQIVHVHRPDVPTESFNINQELPQHPALPGLQIRVADFFRR